MWGDYPTICFHFLAATALVSGLAASSGPALQHPR